MDRRKEILSIIKETPVISIVRGVKKIYVERLIDSLIAGGIRCLEITMNTPGALSMIKEIRERYPRVSIGAGTVLSLQDAEAAIAEGVDFILSPILSIPVIELCNKKDILPIPGVFTPTEILTASLTGAELVKVFPAGPVGPGYIKDLLGPFDGLRLLPVGGITLENTADFMKAGAFAVGIGSALVNQSLAEQEKFTEIQRRAEQFIFLSRSK